MIEGPTVGLFRPDFLAPKLLGLGVQEKALSRLEARLGAALWSTLPGSEQLHLNLVDRNLGKPLVLSPPISLFDDVGDELAP